MSEEATRNPSSCEAQNAKFCTSHNLSFDPSTTEDNPLYLTSFTEKKSSQSQGKGHCSLLSKDWKTASLASTGDRLAPQQPRVAMGRHYAYVPFDNLLEKADGKGPAILSTCEKRWRFFACKVGFLLQDRTKSTICREPPTHLRLLPVRHFVGIARFLSLPRCTFSVTKIGTVGSSCARSELVRDDR